MSVTREGTVLDLEVKTSGENTWKVIKIEGAKFPQQLYPDKCQGYDLVAKGKRMRFTLEKNVENERWEVIKAADLASPATAPAPAFTMDPLFPEDDAVQAVTHPKPQSESIPRNTPSQRIPAAQQAAIAAPARQYPAPDSHNRSFALAYAKDMAVGGIISPGEILTWADTFVEWLNGGGTHDRR